MVRPETHEILRALELELATGAQHIDFRVTRTEREGEIWIVYVDTQHNQRRGLDESLEGSAAWWPGPPNGSADVLSVLPETEQINLRFASAPPPGEGEIIRIYPPRYLEPLIECWRDQLWPNQCLSWLDSIREPDPHDPGQVPDWRPFPWLRTRQREAFDLFGHRIGFLQGPPGTGKTTTLGAMLAQYLLHFPEARVLLLSTTNTAVDQVLIAVDKALEQLANSAAAQTRRCLARVGNHFIAANYQGREHLLPVKDPQLIKQLSELETTRPDAENVAAYSHWKKAIEEVRQKLRSQTKEVIRRARLTAATTTRAVFDFKTLNELAPFDLVVFDEGSQVGLAHALALAPLGDRVLVAGDDKQLAPVAQVDHPTVERWLGRSLFDAAQGRSVGMCFLDEQSRMAEPICSIVSGLFYQGELRVADDCKNKDAWLSERSLVNIRSLSTGNIHIQHIEQEGTWSAKYHGPIRYMSAEFIRDVVAELTCEQEAEDIVVLTPFRAQRTLIRSMLRHAGVRGVQVSTVHRAQGSERHTVLFDPVKGNDDFLLTSLAQRLVNVALSRAKARVIITLSPGDRENPLFEKLVKVHQSAHYVREAVPISDFIRNGNGFPDNCVGMVVRIGSYVGRVISVSIDRKKFKFFDMGSGEQRTFLTEFVKNRYG